MPLRVNMHMCELIKFPHLPSTKKYKSCHYIPNARQRLGKHIPEKRTRATGRPLLGNGPVNMPL
jgi:hypothetical protein